MERRLSAILAADVVGYCRLMQADDAGTLVRLKDCLNRIVLPLVEQHGGDVFKLAGDGVFAAFPSAVGATQCAEAFQQAMKRENSGLDPDRRMEFRIGLHLGEVIRDDGDIFGDGVNIAARLQVVSDPGRVCVSQAVRDQVHRKIEAVFEDMGEQAFRNIEDPIRVYRLAAPRAGPAQTQTQTQTQAQAQKQTQTQTQTQTQARVAEKSGSRDFTHSDRPSIAILPFRDLGGSAPDECLADGLRLSIQSALVQLSGLFLVNVNGVERFRDNPVSAIEAGNILKTRYVLDGTVQKAGSQVRAHLQLTDVAAGVPIWSEKADCKEDDLFALQDQISEQVVTSLGVELLGVGAGFNMARTLPSPRARELFYRSVSHMYKGTAKDNARARSLFEEFAQEFPQSGHILGNVALTHFLDSFFGWTGDKRWSDENAQIWADRSIERGDLSGFGNVVSGNLALFNGQHDAAERFGRNGVGIRISCPLARGQFGQIQIFNGDPVAGVRSARYALHLERVYPPWLLSVLAIGYRDTGEPALAVRVAGELVRLSPDDLGAKVVLCSALEMAGRGSEASAIAGQIHNLDSTFRVHRYVRSQPYRSAEMPDRLSVSLERSGLPV